MLTIRPAQWPQDVSHLSNLDTTCVSGRIFRPVREEFSFRLEEVTVTPPLRKQYPFDPSDPLERRNWDIALIAEEEGALAGFTAAQAVAWNRRVIIWHLYVMPSYQRRGVATQMIAKLDAFARSVKAHCLWLETQNINYPAIQFYRHSGFEFCGLDEMLYDPQDVMHDEVALFFARPVGE